MGLKLRVLFGLGLGVAVVASGDRVSAAEPGPVACVPAQSPADLGQQFTPIVAAD